MRMNRLCRFNVAQLAGVCSSCNSGKGRSRLGLTRISYGFSLVKGKANHPMEDYHVATFVQTKGHELGYLLFLMAILETPYLLTCKSIYSTTFSKRFQGKGMR